MAEGDAPLGARRRTADRVAAAAVTPALLVAGYYGGLGWLLGGAIGFRAGCVLAALAVWAVAPAPDRRGTPHPSR